MEAEESDVEETSSTLATENHTVKNVSKTRSSGLTTRLKILQDFGEITEEDLNEAERFETEDTSEKENETTGNIQKSTEEEVLPDDLPVKLPPDITVVKEVVPASETSTPIKRKRGRARRTDTLPPPVVQSQKKDVTPNSDKSFSCSICPRTFNSDFGRKIHESACRRHSGIPKEEVPDPEDVQDPDEQEDNTVPVNNAPEEVVVKRRRGRPPKNSTPVDTPQERPPDPVYKCDLCSRAFSTLVGCRRHEASCKRDPPGVNSDGFQPSIPIYNKQLNLNQPLETTIIGEEVNPEELDIKDPYIFQEGRCHCCGEDIETAHLGGEFECTDCKKLFRLKSSLDRHRRVVHNEGETYQCPECDARCPDKGTLARHMYTHTGLKPVSCPVCKTEFSRKYHLIRHNYQTGCDGSKKPSFPCQVCGRIFNRKDNLREHLRAHAGQTKRKKKYTCELCNEEFLGTALLNLHKRTHMVGLLDGDKPFGCDFCNKRFPSNATLTKHRRKHTGERPFECTFCFARFSAKETLNRHLRTHTGIKPHVCQYCGKGFIQASQLRAHVFHHSGVLIKGEGGFSCDQCDKSFNRRQRLQLHIKYVHEGAEPFKCDNCSRTFLRKEDLARHQLLHSGIKEHKCPICEKAFAMKSSLKIHLLTHTKEPPRSCDECGRAFIRQDCLLRHMRTKHRDMLEEIMAEAEKKKLQQQLLAAANQAALALPAEEPHVLTEDSLAESVRELLSLLVDETTLKAFGWPDSSVDKLLEAVIRRCGHQPAGCPGMPYADRLRDNAKLLFTVVIDDSAVKTLLNNQTVDEVILHVLRLAKS